MLEWKQPQSHPPPVNAIQHVYRSPESSFVYGWQHASFTVLSLTGIRDSCTFEARLHSTHPWEEDESTTSMWQTPSTSPRTLLGECWDTAEASAAQECVKQAVLLSLSFPRCRKGTGTSRTWTFPCNKRWQDQVLCFPHYTDPPKGNYVFSQCIQSLSRYNTKHSGR